ncbi:uncharacterized protein LOC117343943 [Pecten maximus]|uniref:uncharacterized protein LOC117343943 n=1 Tax=Pecten maximus TaxID=6579 RepID=UPI001458DC0C|nr:uncharacterized protein LOC117343943 [Pecten maximus]
MAKIRFLHLALLIVIFLIVCEAKHQSHLTSTGVNVPPTSRAGNDVTTDGTNSQKTGLAKSLAKSILKMLLSRICGKEKIFNLKRKRCEHSSEEYVRAFGNPGLGK